MALRLAAAGALSALMTAAAPGAAAASTAGVAAASPVAPAADTAPASLFAYEPLVEQPRSFGHFVGDVLTQRIPLDPGDHRIHPSLPAADRVGLWFARLPPRIETDAAGRRWLIVAYQVINSPLLPVSVALPALTLASDAGPPLKIGSWPIHLSPLAAKPAYANSEPLPLRPDHLPAPLPTRSLERQVLGWSLALACMLCAWLVWILWAERRDARRLPFARALRQLRGDPPVADARGADAPGGPSRGRPLRGGASPGGDDAGAWICLHRALNETAGRVIQGSSVDQLLAAAPQFEPMRAALQDFYQRSSERFFARSSPQTPFPLLEFCRNLRRIEKRTSHGRASRS